MFHSCRELISGAATKSHNLRPSTQRILSDNANEQIDADIGCESIGDFLCDNDGN
jgi:hypothetical protein